MGRRVSIVIPTWNHCDDLLKPCIESIERNTTDKYHLEYVVVSNGSTDNTQPYCIDIASKLNNTSRAFKYDIIGEQIGFTKAANVGFKMATAPYIIILNNDVEVLDWGGKDTWLDKMFAPFDVNEKVAATGPLKIFDNYSNRLFLVGFCVMYRADLLKEFGYFDEAFAPAGGEDVDLCIKFQDAGWEIAAVQETKFVGWTNTGDFPMWHKDNRSYKELPEYTKHIIKRNGHLNLKRHSKCIKLNLGSGGIDYQGFISVDLYDQRAQIMMDITKPMDFATDSVEEIMAIHVIEHISPYKVTDMLKEWYRILKPGGKLALEMPNIEEQCKAFGSANKQERYGILNVIYGSVNTTDKDDPTAITAPHLFGWYPEIIGDHLSDAGFTDIQFMPEQIPHPHINFRVEAYKKTSPTPKKEILINKPSENIQMDTTYKEPETSFYGETQAEIEGNVVIDIGAFEGRFSINAIRLGAKTVYAFEINTNNHLQLYKNTNTIPNIHTELCAIYNTDHEHVKYFGEGMTCKVSDDGEKVAPTRSLKSILDAIPKEENNIVLKMDCEGSEHVIIPSTPVEDLRRIKTVYAEIHGEKTNELVKYLADIGFSPTDMNRDVVYVEKDTKTGAVLKTEILAKTFRFIREDLPVKYSIPEQEIDPYGVTAYISTKDRYFTTLPLAITSIITQTWRVNKLIIFDDGEQTDLRNTSLYGNLFRMIEMKGINWEVVFGEKKGQVANHQKALDMAKTEFIWRVDDDNYPESNVLAKLMEWITVSVEAWELPFGAVGSLIRVPYQEIFPLEKCSPNIQHALEYGNLQWSAFSGVLHTDHLHNSFLYRKSAAKHGYQKNLSPVGHREETLFTYGIKMNGYRLLVCGDAITWHLRESKGGIRSFNDVSLWEHDDKIFKEEMKKYGVMFDNKKYVVLDNGVGDHYAFKHILEELKSKYGKENIVLATCYPEIFEGDGIRQISIADANILFGDLTRFNIYHWMWTNQWNKSIVDAFRTMYL